MHAKVYMLSWKLTLSFVNSSLVSLSHISDTLVYSMWLLQAFVGFVTMTTSVVSFSIGAALLVIITALPGIVFQHSVSKRSWKVMNASTPDVRRMNYLRDLLTDRTAAKETRLFGMKRLILGRYDTLFSGYAFDFLGTLSLNTRENLLMSAISGSGL